MADTIGTPEGVEKMGKEKLKGTVLIKDDEKWSWVIIREDGTKHFFHFNGCSTWGEESKWEAFYNLSVGMRVTFTLPEKANMRPSFRTSDVGRSLKREALGKEWWKYTKDYNAIKEISDIMAVDVKEDTTIQESEAIEQQAKGKEAVAGIMG